MSNVKRVYPPEHIAKLDERSHEFSERSFYEVSRKYRLEENKLEEMVCDLGNKLSDIMSPDMIGTRPTGSGFKAVDYDHFRKVQNLRITHFMQQYFIDSIAVSASLHELGLMVLEIKELRAVLLHQFGYNWKEHRKNHPLIAQDMI